MQFVLGSDGLPQRNRNPRAGPSGGRIADSVPATEVILRGRNRPRLRREPASIHHAKRADVAGPRDRVRRHGAPSGIASAARRGQFRCLLPARRSHRVCLNRLVHQCPLLARPRTGLQPLRHELGRLRCSPVVLRPRFGSAPRDAAFRPGDLQSVGLHRHHAHVLAAVDGDEPRRHRTTRCLWQQFFLSELAILPASRSRIAQSDRCGAGRLSHKTAHGRTGLVGHWQRLARSGRHRPENHAANEARHSHRT